MEKLYVLLFYKFTDIGDLESFRRVHERNCKEIGLLGRILIGEEGINGSVSGTREQVDAYKKLLSEDERFKGIVFKEDEVISRPFTKMIVRIRDEIVTFKQNVCPSVDPEDYITAEELNELYETKEAGKDFVVLDTRNDYEYKVGRFKNSIHLNIKNFRDFPEALKQIEHLKDKTIITFCTGGIRCEKALPYMKEQGFKKVKQLKDGILTYGKKFPDKDWEGKCFVFDKRLVAPINSEDFEKDTITECENCGEPCDLYKNCRNNNCDKLFISCVKCQEKLIGCCSEDCLSELRQKFLEKSARNQGRKVSALG